MKSSAEPHDKLVGGAAVFAIGNVAEVRLGLEFGTVLFGLELMGLIASILLFGAATLRAKVLPSGSNWHLIVELLAFLPVVNVDVAMLVRPLGQRKSQYHYRNVVYSVRNSLLGEHGIIKSHEAIHSSSNLPDRFIDSGWKYLRQRTAIVTWLGADITCITRSRE